MLHPNYVVTGMLVEALVAERQRDATKYRLQRPMKARRRSWLLSRIGHLLVRLGRRLQQSGSAQPVPTGSVGVLSGE
jgi:hypothetical protein